MTVSAVAIPTPPNSNMDRAMFVWCGSAGGAGDPLATDQKMQALLNFCAANGINVLFLDMWGYLGGGNWSTAHAQTVQKLLHYAHASGIRVMALAGNTDWGHNQQWVATNIVKALAQFQAYGAANALTDSWFDGVMLDVEYWTSPGYTAAEPIGLIDLMNAMRHTLDLPVGCALTQWLADGTSAALTITYGTTTDLEGKVIMANCDFVAVMDYYNTSTQQISQFQNWFNAAALPGVGANFGLWCTSLTDSGIGGSYWTGSPGAKAAMETAHTAISQAFTATPNTNMAFRGQAINAYASYSQMT